MFKKISTTKPASERRRSRRHLLKMLAAAGVFLGAGLLQSCEKDILTGQPEWLGNSIYERLQEGIETNDGQYRSFEITLQLIKDLGYEETLGRTGSKTLFVTPDDIFLKWFEANGLSYESLTLTQKKQLFNSSMVNNANLINLMSNVSGNPPETGSCMRRETASTLYDSIPVMPLADMPVNPMGDVTKDAWAKVVEAGKSIRICKDMTSPTMIHFLPDFMKKNNITDLDLQIISNGQSDNINDSWISGRKVISKEQTCKNGYIYVVDGVIEGSPNMAQAIHNEPSTKMWAQAIDRFSCPEEITDNTIRQTFQKQYGTDEKLYNLRYFTGFSKRPYLKAPSFENNLNSMGTLRFDPGWNHYEVPTSTQTMAHDAAVMIVPTDEAVKAWLETGGRDLKDRFGSWENIDYETLAKLVNVNMLESFVASVPSKFESVLDYTSQSKLGITPDDIVKCIMCSNGVIYLVKQVFAPDSYSTVIYPIELQTNGTYSVMGHAITGYTGDKGTYSSANDFSPYLSAIDSKFSLIVPFNTTNSLVPSLQGKTKVFRYIDPCSYGMPNQRIIEFYYLNDQVQGVSYEMKEEGGVLQPPSTTQQLSVKQVQNRLYDLIDNNIIVGLINDGQLYYKTKTGGVLKAYKQDGVQYIDGGYQIEKGESLMFPASCIVDKALDGNGVTYGASSEEAMQGKICALPMSATKSVYQVLQEEKTDTMFYHLLSASELLSTKEGSQEPAGVDNKNINIFDSYNYTVYVPRDEAINDLIAKGYLPTWKDYDDLADDEERGVPGAKEKRELIKARINNFLRYHVQDNSVLINSDNVSQSYETGKLNTKTNRFYTLQVEANASSLKVTDNEGQTRSVITSDGFYNKLAREYWISNKGKSTSELNSSSFAVIHKIDGVLIYDKAQQLIPWK